MVACDLPWQDYLGTQTRSLMFFLGPIAFIWTRWQNRPLWMPQEKMFGVYAALTMLTSLMIFTTHVLTGGSATAFGKNLFTRTLLTGYENVTYFFAICTMVTLFLIVPIARVERYFQITFVLLTLLALFEMNSKLTFAWMHGTTSAFSQDGRISLLNSEPSQAFPTYAAFYFMTALALIRTNASKAYLVVITAVFLGIALAIGSKGGLPIFLTAMVIPIFSVPRKQHRSLAKILVIGLPVIIIMGLIYEQQSLPDLEKSIDTFTSVGTRASGFVSALFTLKRFPLGMGYGTFYSYYPQVLLDAAGWIESLIQMPLNLKEIFDMVGTGETLSAKAGIPTQVAYNGFIALWFYLSIFRRGWRNVIGVVNPGQAYLLRAMLAFMVLTLLFGADINTLYVFILPLALLDAGVYGRTDIIKSNRLVISKSTPPSVILT